jgi:hypothetical protein
MKKYTRLATAAFAATTLALAGCASDDEPAADDAGVEEPADDATVEEPVDDAGLEEDPAAEEEVEG